MVVLTLLAGKNNTGCSDFGPISKARGRRAVKWGFFGGEPP